MEINTLKIVSGPESSRRIQKADAQFRRLLAELKNFDIPDPVTALINEMVDGLNALDGTEKEWLRELRKSQTAILERLEKDLNLSTKHMFRNRWMAMGMSVFGVPIGVSIGAAIGNMAFIGTGIAVGMAIGLAIGESMDKKARAGGRQLNIEIV